MSSPDIETLPMVVDKGPFGSLVVINMSPDASEQLVQKAYTALFAWADLAARAYSMNTCEAWNSDWKTFTRFCLQNGRQPLPASPESVSEFIHHRVSAGLRPASIARSIATIATAHRAAAVPNPCESEMVRLGKRAMYRELGARQSQARGLTWSEIERYLQLPVLLLRDHRDRAMITTAYDTMCRSEELMAFDLSDFAWNDDGSAVVVINRSKTDQEGEGKVVFLSRSTANLLKSWIRESGIQEGAIFRAIQGKSDLGNRLAPTALCERLRCIGRWIGLDSDAVNNISGHSCRVGATQDLFAANFQLPIVMQQGRWKDPRMPALYGERILASKTAMAQLAEIQGR